MRKLVEAAKKRLPGVDEREIEEKLRILIEEFRIDEKEAVRAVVNKLAREHGVNLEPPTLKVSELEDFNGTVNLKFKVLKVAEVKSKKVSRRLVVGDETGVTSALVIRDVKANFEAGKVYTVKGAFKGEALVITKGCIVVEEEGEDIEVPPITFGGAIVAITKTSGIVPRCPECNRIVKRGQCEEHGKVKPKPSFEARVTIDDGKVPRNVTISEEKLTELSGLTRKEAIEMRINYTEEVLYNELAKRLIGKYVKVTVDDGKSLVEVIE